MLTTKVSVSHVEKEKLLIASVFVFSNKIYIKSRIRYISKLCNLWAAITEAICKLNIRYGFISIYLHIGQGLYCGSYKCIHIFAVTCLGLMTISE
jgi:hypothetical protein